MRKISIAAAVSLSLSGVTNLSHALGLGEIEMYSALNQTLDAEIAILSATEAEIRDMNVSLASARAFARAGLVQSPVLSSVNFSVDKRPDGKAVVKVTSDAPVLEPFLNFLIEVDSPGSVKLVREYTVLLNPTTFADNQTNKESDQMLATAGSAGVFANTAADGTGVQIDLADAIPSSFESNDSIIGDEVVFTETSVESFTDSDASGDTLFIPDAGVLSESAAGTTVIDSDGQVISLTQELNTTPTFNNPSSSVGGQSIDLSGVSQNVPLDSLSAQADAGVGSSGNPIFTNEFESSQSELIAGDELRGLVGEVDPVTPVVEFQVSTLDQETTLAQVSTTEILVDLGDTDAQGGAGDLIDLSGLFDDSDSVFVEEAPTAGNSATTIRLSGDTYQVRSQDTLWSIANGVKSSGVTTHQMVVALVDANPQAFIGGNMNRMISGAVLQIPMPDSQRSTDRASAVAIVQSWTRGNTPSVRRVVNIEPATTFSSGSSNINNDLGDVTQRYEEVRTEVATGTVERDELQNRVDSLTDNMAEMKSLITVRENELIQLQDEVQDAESNAAAIDAQISQLSNASDNMAATQQGLTDDLQQAQEAIARQADEDKNRATIEAEAQTIRLASEEDALRSQLSAIEIEKRDLEANSQTEAATLAGESAAEKTRMLAQAQAERESIRAELEAEKMRISNEAEMEIARINSEPRTVQVEPEPMQVQAPESEPMSDTTAMVESGESSRVKDRLAQLQQEGGDKAADLQASISNTVDTDDMKLDTDTDAVGKVSDMAGDAGKSMADTGKGMADAGKSMAASGAAAVTGLLGLAPLQETLGNRKTILAAGAGLSLLGLLGAWGLRRRKAKPVEVKGLRPRGEGRPVVAPQQGRAVKANQAKYDREAEMYDDASESYAKPQKRASSSAAAAAAAAAAAVTGTAAVATSRGTGSVEQDKPLAPSVAVQPVATERVAAPESTQAAPPAAKEEPSAANTASANKSKAEADLEEKALDDTITEAEVYLRYGLHGQAEDLLKTAVERSPNNEEYHFKLLENYHDQKNSSDFNIQADKFNGKFPNSGHKARIAEMGAEIADSKPAIGSDTSGSGLGMGGTLAAGAASAAAMATGVAANAKNAATDGLGSLTESGGDMTDDLLDQTIDPGAEFSVDELQATGNLGAFTDNEFDLADHGGLDQGGLSLDDVDLASLDDDGTMNLEEIAGSQMSGNDLGSLDLTNPVDTSFEDLSLTDTNLGDTNLGGIAGGIAGGAAGIAGGLSDKFGNSLDADLPINSPAAGGTDEMETMLDLAKAYIDMGDNDNASKALKDIATRGNPLQQTEAAELLKKLS